MKKRVFDANVVHIISLPTNITYSIVVKHWLDLSLILNRIKKQQKMAVFFHLKIYFIINCFFVSTPWIWICTVKKGWDKTKNNNLI